MNLEALERPPNSAEPLFWCDFLELRALIHPDRCFSRGDLVGVEQRHHGTTKSENSIETRWHDLMNFSETRLKEFGNSYPFSISNDRDTLEFSFNETPQEMTYLRLLLAALMRHIPKSLRNELARNFEETCFMVFSKLMPSGSEIRATWASGGAEAPYRGSLFEKMKKIAEDLRCEPNFKSRDFNQKDTGDGGIDLISWHPMTDHRKGMPISFAQCGCSKDDWKFKQLEASTAKHYSHLPVMHPWACYYFLPLDFRHSDGGWAYESDLGQTIIVDRLRLIRLTNQYQLNEQLPSFDKINDILEIKYS